MTSYLTTVVLAAIIQIGAKVSQYVDELLLAMPLISRLPLELAIVVDVVKMIVELGIFRPRTFVSVGDQCFGEAYAAFRMFRRSAVALAGSA